MKKLPLPPPLLLISCNIYHINLYECEKEPEKRIEFNPNPIDWRQKDIYRPFEYDILIFESDTL